MMLILLAAVLCGCSKPEKEELTELSFKIRLTNLNSEKILYISDSTISLVEN
ncbi:MAG: hypothetical protein IJA55_07895 [Clostridia bacterium]|nr:hypothetical protein [Clostridia bacterium]